MKKRGWLHYYEPGDDLDVVFDNPIVDPGDPTSLIMTHDDWNYCPACGFSYAYPLHSTILTLEAYEDQITYLKHRLDDPDHGMDFDEDEGYYQLPEEIYLEIMVEHWRSVEQMRNPKPYRVLMGDYLHCWHCSTGWPGHLFSIVMYALRHRGREFVKQMYADRVALQLHRRELETQDRIARGLPIDDHSVIIIPEGKSTWPEICFLPNSHKMRKQIVIG